MKLLVGSVFTSGEKTGKWLELQRRFLERTTAEFHHAVFLNGPVDRSLFRRSEIVGTHHEDRTLAANGEGQGTNHAHGLFALLEYFRSRRAENYLILDSDCFPIYPGWLDSLLGKMNSTPDYRPQIAAAVRIENLDVFPHPCVMLIRGEAIHENWLNLGVGRTRTLLQAPIEDNCCSIPLEKCYPLLRSNVHSHHPMFATVYNHMFYHHACGSRDLVPRCVVAGYYDHYIHREEHIRIKNGLFDRLIADPEGYIAKLTGAPRPVRRFHPRQVVARVSNLVRRQWNGAVGRAAMASGR